MKWPVFAALLVATVVAAFWAGSRYGQNQAGSSQSSDGRQILYYVDPMNPAHTSDKPGKAPCGMDMEPVYADTSSGPDGTTEPMPPGTIKVSLEKQQLIGVRVAPVERKALSHSLRLLGKVAADETRIYLINATIDGWITKAGPQASGTFVKKDETLATFYSSEFLSAGNALLYALSSKDRIQTTGTDNPARQSQLAQFEINLKQYADSLRNLGMGEPQLEEMMRTRQYMENIDVVAPADGFVIARNVSDGQRFEKGTELFRIADLSRVWILADVFEKEARLMPARLQARVSLPEQAKTFTATLTETLPQFDGISRTLKLRFDAENPEFVLKPDMFVDVEIPVSLPEGIVVPAEAVLDAGLRKTVYVDRGNGYFEPRNVQTGAQLGSEVQILHGLTADEQIVVSGNFLLDSESRMKLAAAGVHSASAIDPVCGMTVDEQKARAANRWSQHEGKSTFFCSDMCKKRFDADPSSFIEKKASQPGHAMHHPAEPAPPEGKEKDPVCAMEVDKDKAKAAGRVATWMQQTFYFCSDVCKTSFEASPVKYVENSLHGYYLEPPTNMPMAAPDSKAVDPVCKMTVTIEKATAAGRVSDYQGKKYYFCNDSCKEEFDSGPAKFVEQKESQPGHAMHHPAEPGKQQGKEKDPVCAMEVDKEKAKAAGRVATWMQQTFYFCSDVCKTSFEASPVKYVENSLHGYYLEPPTNMPMATPDSKAVDPVCKMTVTIEKATAAGRVSDYQGKKYYFCNDSCKKEFDSGPAKYLKSDQP